MDTKKTAFITGASSGIGEEFAKQLAMQGYDLIITARRKDKLEALAEALREKHKIQVEVIVADLKKDEDITLLEHEIKERDDIYIFVNNAGYGILGRFPETDINKSLTMMQVHMNAGVRLVHAVLPQMMVSNEGAIINVSSLGGILPLPGSVIYSATKAFLNAFSEALQMELKKTRIKVQALCPGMTHTGFHFTEELKDFDHNSVPDLFWQNVENVVSYSLKSLHRRKVICIPGFLNRLSARLRPLSLAILTLKQ